MYANLLFQIGLGCQHEWEIELSIGEPNLVRIYCSKNNSFLISDENIKLIRLDDNIEFVVSYENIKLVELDENIKFVVSDEKIKISWYQLKRELVNIGRNL
jgi:hypothetical protein